MDPKSPGNVTNPHNVPERRIWHLDLWFSCQICKITCSQTTPWGLHSCEHWRAGVIPTRSAFIHARTALPLSCPLAAPSNFKCGSEGSVGRIQEDSLLKPKGGNFQRSHMPLRETTVIPRQLRPSHSSAQYDALPLLPFSFSGSFTQWPCS